MMEGYRQSWWIVAADSIEWALLWKRPGHQNLWAPGAKVQYLLSKSSGSPADLNICKVPVNEHLLETGAIQIWYKTSTKPD
jgi:hypothetical protein